MGALLKLLPTVAGWISTAVTVGRDKAAAQLARQAEVASGWAAQLLVLFWFYPAVAGYVPALRESAGEGFQALVGAPEWYWQLLIGITVAVLGLSKIPVRGRDGRIGRSAG